MPDFLDIIIYIFKLIGNMLLYLLPWWVWVLLIIVIIIVIVVLNTYYNFFKTVTE